MDLWDAVRRAKREHWTEALYWLLLTLLGGLMPLWGLLVLLRLFSQAATFETFTAHGELALYSAAMLSTAFYVVSKDYSSNLIREILARLKSETPRGRLKADFPSSRLFLSIFLMLLIISTLLFAGATFAHMPNVNLRLDVEWLTFVTSSIFFLTVACSYLVTVLDNSIDIPPEEFSRESKEQELELESQFDAIQRGHQHGQ